TLETVMSTQIARGFVANSFVEQYMNLARVYFAADGGMSEEAIVAAVLQDLALEADVEKIHFGIATPIDTTYVFYTEMLNYILLVICFLSVTNLSLVFKRTDLRRRNLCAPISSRSFNMQQILASAAMSFVGWVILVALGFIMYGSNLGGVDNRIIALMVLNTFVLLVFAMAIAALGSIFVNSRNAQNAVANIVTMALCFLGGVFVPTQLLGDGVIAVSRFLPTYWNVIALARIGNLTALDAYSLRPVWEAMGIQLVFAAAVFAVTLLLSKHVGQSERFASSIRTEVEV
ncbi:MAG: ABC transporter permease, partial [Oscillospiraceae bacterium]|nr:ABC transporter permease [Oscillospiraceae bacterium]